MYWSMVNLLTIYSLLIYLFTFSYLKLQPRLGDNISDVECFRHERDQHSEAFIDRANGYKGYGRVAQGTPVGCYAQKFEERRAKMSGKNMEKGWKKVVSLVSFQ